MANQEQLNHLHQQVLYTQSIKKDERDQCKCPNSFTHANFTMYTAAKFFESIRLDGATSEAFMTYMQTECSPANGITEDHQLAAGIQLKNMLLQIYGTKEDFTNYIEKNKKESELLAEDDPANRMDENGRQVLQNRLVPLLMYSQSVQKSRLAKQLIEMIGIMARRFVQKQWPTLFPSLIQQLSNQNLDVYRVTFECIKKVCKKYRYMNRSDDLYTEMNYVIENASEHLVGTLRICITHVQ